MHGLAKGWMVYQLSGSKFWLGLDGFAGGVPVVLTPLAGVLADRMDRRWVLGVGNFLAGIFALVLAALFFTHGLQVWHIVTVSLLMGIISALMFPAYQSLLPELVGPGDLANAVALNSLQFNTSRVIGPALGGAVLAGMGAGWSFTFNAISFLAVVGAVMAFRARPRRHQVDESHFESLRFGLRYLRSRPDIVIMLLLVLLAGVLAGPLGQLMPALSKDLFGGGPKELAWLMSCFGAGAVIGALLMAARSKHAPTPWRAFVTLPALGAAQVAIGLVHWLSVALVLVAATGALWVGTMARLNTAILSSTPAHLRGRVSSFFVMAFMAGLPLGGLVAGALAQWVGLRPVLWSFGGLLMCSVLGLLNLARRYRVVYQAALTVGQPPPPPL
jgi:predicted MFS family arabinose efflux permease